MASPTVRELVLIQRAAERTAALVRTVKFVADEAAALRDDFPELGLDPEVNALLGDLVNAVERAKAIMKVLEARVDLA